MNPHEPELRGQEPPIPSERSFGLLLGTVFALAALWPLVRGGQARPWWLLPAAASVAIGLWRPALLRPALRLWMTFGDLMARVVNPIVLGIMFYGLVTPVALLMRALRHDPLGLKLKAGVDSYWLPRDRAVAPDLREQF